MPDQPSDSVWVVTGWDPATHEVEFVKVTPGPAVGRIRIALESAGADGASTLAEVSYEYTALSEAGEEFVRRFTEAHYEAFMNEVGVGAQRLPGERPAMLLIAAIVLLVLMLGLIVVLTGRSDD